MRGTVTLDVADYEKLAKARDAVNDLIKSARRCECEGTTIEPWIAYDVDGVLMKHYPDRYERLKTRLLKKKEAKDDAEKG